MLYLVAAARPLFHRQVVPLKLAVGIGLALVGCGTTTAGGNSDGSSNNGDARTGGTGGTVQAGTGGVGGGGTGPTGVGGNRAAGTGGSGAPFDAAGTADTVQNRDGAADSPALSDAGAQISYANPIIPGMHPDPSIVRVGDDFYVVHSTFEYFPGLPIFHSRDLVNWHQVGHALTRPSQLSLVGAVSGLGGIYAATIRYQNGTFYIVCTNVSGGGNFVVTATNPAGPWSEPVWISDPMGGNDPSLFFDTDGKVYFTRQALGERGGIYQNEMNLPAGTLVAQPRLIWSGTGNPWPEGPHLYKIGQTYYLMIAEGGTEYGHMETIARSSSPWGPFESCPRNPILSHKDLPTLPIQATGHADLVQTPNGNWWMVFLGIRPSDGVHHHLGRETFLAPVTWDAAGWPVVHGSQPIALAMSNAGLPPAQPWPAEPVRDDFTAMSLGSAWNLVRNPRATDWSLSARPGFLRLLATAVSLDDMGSPTFVGRRQAHFSVRASASLDFRPDRAGQEAGLAARQNEANHYDVAVTVVGTQRRVRLRTRVAGVSTVVAERDLADGIVTLSITASRDQYEFSYAVAGAAAVSLGTAPTALLSAESAGGFTGVYLGMYGWAGTGTSQPAADFDWFEYAVP